MNGILSKKCPKTNFCGKIKVAFAVTDTISYFNTGAASQITLLISVTVESSSNIFSAMPKQNQIVLRLLLKIFQKRSEFREGSYEQKG